MAGSKTLGKRKRRWNSDSSEVAQEFRPLQRRKEETVALAQDANSQELITLDEEDVSSTCGGLGIRDDPFNFPQWATDNCTRDLETDKFIELLEDEGLEDIAQRSIRNPHLKSSLPASSSQETLLDEAASLRYDTENEHDENSDESTDELLSDDELYMQSLQSTHFSSLSVTSTNNSDNPLRSSQIEAFEDSEADEEWEDETGTIFEDLKSESTASQSQLMTYNQAFSLEDEQPLPGLTLSQSTVDSESTWNRGSSQDALRFSEGALDEHVENVEQGEGSNFMTFGSQQQTTGQESITWEDEYDWDKPMSVEERKDLFFKTYWTIKQPSLERTLERYYSTLEKKRDPDACWLYSGHRLPKRPKCNIRVSVTFQHNGKPEKLTVNIMFVSMLLKGLLTKTHIEGIVNHAWHASHLCGNWTCINERHVNPEPGSINLNRNPCFADRDGPCAHVPACMKTLKVATDTLRPTLRSKSNIFPLDGDIYSLDWLQL